MRQWRLAAHGCDHGLGCGGGTTGRAEPHNDSMPGRYPVAVAHAASAVRALLVMLLRRRA
jgi:hypothetical protein